MAWVGVWHGLTQAWLVPKQGPTMLGSVSLPKDLTRRRRRLRIVAVIESIRTRPIFSSGEEAGGSLSLVVTFASLSLVRWCPALIAFPALSRGFPREVTQMNSSEFRGVRYMPKALGRFLGGVNLV